MYNYTFYYFRLLFKSLSKKKDRTIDVAIIIFFMQLFQFLLIDTFLKRMFHFSFLQKILTHDYFRNKVVLMPFLFVWVFLLYGYFNKNISKIEERYNGKILLDFKNTIIIIIIVFVPSILACYLGFS